MLVKILIIVVGIVVVIVSTVFYVTYGGLKYVRRVDKPLSDNRSASVEKVKAFLREANP